MSFSAEMKDFVSAYRSTATASRYAGTSAKKKPTSSSDPAGIVDSTVNADPENDAPKDEHGWLYHLGQWFHPTQAPYDPTADNGTGGSGADNQYADADGQPTQAFSRGGYVRAYADGGAVPLDNDDDLAPVNVTPQNSAIPLDTAPAAAATPDTAAPAPPPPPEPAASAISTDDTPPPAAQSDTPDGSSLGSALHGGIMWLQKNLGLDQSDNAIPDPQAAAAGKQKLMAGDGAASQDDIKAMAAAVDPQKNLTHSQVMIRGMEKGYEYYMSHGDPDRANKFAAMIIQYSTHEAAKYGDDAIQSLKQGDVLGAAHSLAAGYANLPNGKSAEDVKVNQNGTVNVTETDAVSGKPLATHTINGQQLYQLALGLSNKSMAYSSLMDAAAAVKNVNLPPSDAYTNAIGKLSGDDGLGGSPPAAGAVTPPGNTPAAPAPVPAQTGGVDPSYQRMMASGESSNNPNASNGSSVGLYGMQPAAWAQAMGNSPMVVNGVDQRTVAGPATAAFQKYTQQNSAQFQKAFQRAPTAAEMSVMHQQGAGGGISLLRAAATAPNTPAAQVLAQYMPHARAVAALTGNRIPADATAAQAVQSIQNYYAGKGSAAPQTGGAQSIAIQAPLPEDKPATAVAPTRPTPPTVVRVTPQDINGMSGTERVQYAKTVAATNLANQNKFRDDMQVYNSQVQAAKTKASAPAMSLPVKDRGDALSALEKAAPDPTDTKDPTNAAFASFQPTTQKAIKDIAYGLYTHNDTSPDRAYQAAVNMMVPQKVNFTPYAMPGTDGVKIVFRTGDKMVMPKNTFDQLAAARGNELFVQRKAAEAAAKPGYVASVLKKAPAAVTAAGNIGKEAVVGAGRAALGAAHAVDDALRGRGAIIDTARGVGRAVSQIPSALDFDASGRPIAR